MIGVIVMQGPRGFAAEKFLVDPDHERAHPETLGHRRFEITRPVKFFVQPTGFERLRVGRQHIMAAPRGDRIKCGLGRQHAALDRRVAALDSAGV